MGKKLSLETVQQRICKIHQNIKIIGNYVNTHTKVLCKCINCGYEWSPTPDKLLQGRGCPCCSKRIKGTKESLQKDLDKNNKFIKVIGNYKDRNTPIEVMCNKCNYIWKARPYDLINKCGCPKCSQKVPPTQIEVIQRINKVSPYIQVLSKYINANTPIKCKCKKCNCEWEAIPGNLFHGTGCPRCKESKGERTIESILISNGVNYIRQYFIKNPFGNNKNVYIDFYLPDYNTFIEYNGEQHYIPVEHFGGKIQFNKQIERDQNLRSYCKNNNIKLIEIKYNENKEYLQNIIKTVINKSK